MVEKLGLFGKVALASKLLTQEQLVAAIQEHARQGDPKKHVGQILIELGHITAPQLEKLVAMQRQILEKARARQEEPQTQQGPQSKQETKQEPQTRAEPRTAAQAPRPPSGTEVEALSLDDLLRGAVEAKASDVHIHSGGVIKLRARGEFYNHGSRNLEREESQRLIDEALDPEQRKRLEDIGEIDFCYTIPGVARFRCNAYKQLRGCDAAFRVIPPEPPTLAQLNLPETLEKFTTYHQGMVLLTGPTSCGKSSTMAALVNLINEKRHEHILTIEDPIEYEHASKKCLVNQRSVGPHTRSFARALRGALREDPDIIVIGELRDRESISLAMTAAETGHFVLATLHTDNAIRTVNRVIGAFPPEQQDQVRSMLAESLRAVISQRLLPTADEQGVVPAIEVMVGSLGVGNLIRESKTIQLRSMLQTGGEQGMVLLDASLAQLVKSGRVSREAALREAEDPKLIP